MRRHLLPQVQAQKNDIFLAQILGPKLLPGAAALSIEQGYEDFYVVEG